METLPNLAALEPLCLAMKRGGNTLISIGEHVIQEQASAFAGQMNEKRDEGHVWIPVVRAGFAPEPTTVVQVYCTY